jgi:membrane-bound lytic murein transglycosylase B
MKMAVIGSAMTSKLISRVAAAAGILLGIAAYAAAQVDERLPIVLPPATGSIGAAPGPGAVEWSGQAGASGHPLMSAEAIRAAAANFSGCIEGLWPAAARRGISRQSFDQHTGGLSPDLRIMDLLDAQPEFEKALWDYLDLLVTEERIQRGRELLAQHKATFDAVENAYGVDRHVVAAIWGVETKFGAVAGERPLVRSTATLACVGRRQDYFQNEFLAVLEILHNGDVAAGELKGSWAGAFGGTQFMPTVFKRYAVDFDRDGRRNLVGSIPDLLASTANYLKQNGWAAGQTWGYEVAVPNGFDYRQADRTRVQTMRQWEQLGIRRADGKPFARPDDRAYLMVPTGARGPGFLVLANFRAILRYNPAEAYALAIGHLADRLRGGGPFVQEWPRDERALTRAERMELQQRLASRGFDTGEPDGRFGPKTRAAIRDFQAGAGLTPDGFASGTLLTTLRGR